MFKQKLKQPHEYNYLPSFLTNQLSFLQRLRKVIYCRMPLTKDKHKIQKYCQIISIF